MVVRGNLSDSNIGQGFWFDISCYNTTIVGNVSRNDVGGGIQYEISAKAIIASNLVVGSHAEGIKVGAGSSDVRVYNNTLVRDKRAICVLDDSRPELTNNVTIRNNIISNGAPDSSEMVFTYDSSSPPKTAEQMNITLDYDAYYRTSSSRPATLVRWSRGATLASFNTLGAFRLGTGQEAHGFGIDDVAINPFFVDEAGGDYRLKAGSRAIGAGAPLPADVAAAIGVAAGVPVDLGVLTWATSQVVSAINAGGGAAGAFAADANFSGGSTYSNTDPINTSGVTNLAPQAVYDSERYGNFTYTIPNLTPGASYAVRLHFAEIYWNAAGQRVFNVALNGSPVLSNFDIFAAAGGKDIAVVRQSTAGRTAPARSPSSSRRSRTTPRSAALKPSRLRPGYFMAKGKR